MTSIELKHAIDEHLKKSGQQYYSDFYIGITNDVERRLFTEHKVDRDNGWWIYGPANNSTIAREVEQYYQAKGMRGFSGGGVSDSNIVYCYVVTDRTVA